MKFHLAFLVALGSVAVSSAAEVSYSFFCESLDLRGSDYRVEGRAREGRFSFRPMSGSPEWMELSVAAAVDDRPLPKFVLATRETDLRTAPALTLVYTNAAARAEVTFGATSATLALTIFRPRPCAIGKVTLGPGSQTDSTQVFDPSIRATPFHEFPIRSAIKIEPGLASPPPWLFSYRREGRDGCWSVAWEPQPDRLDFAAVGQVPGEGRSLAWTVHYPGRAAAAGDFIVPPLVFRFGDRDYFAALQRHVTDLRSSGKMQVPDRKLPAWHADTIACTWRYQRDLPRREQATEANCEAYVKMLEDNGIGFGTLIIDDFWGAQHGIWEADPKKWTDLRGFIDRQHAKGRHVLLWVCTDGEGLPEGERLGNQWDLESAAFRDRLRAAARKMLSSEPGCYDADGIKFDFTSSRPGLFGTRRYMGCGYIRRRFEMLSEACLAVKPTAILDYQCYNPYFTHALTMLRLNDYFGAPENGLEEMRLRAKIASICAPGALIDMDHVGYRQYSYKGAYDFFRQCRTFGVESLYLGPQDMEDAELMSILRPSESVVAETRALQAAIDAKSAAGGGRVVVAPGRHLVGSLFLKDNVELHLAKGAVLEGSNDVRDYPGIRLECSEMPAPWQAIVWAVDATNVAVTGAGEIYGNGSAFAFACPTNRPRGLIFLRCSQVRCEGFRLRDTAFWGCYFKECMGVTAKGLTISNHANSNNDGLDIESKNVLVADCTIDTGDDAICLKSDNPRFTVENVLVTNCTVASCCSALKFGTASHGTARKIRFVGCRVRECAKGLVSPGGGEDHYLAGHAVAYPGSRRGFYCGAALQVDCVDGGTVEDVVFDGIDIEACLVPFFIRGGERRNRSFAGLKTGLPFGSARRLADITIRNVKAKAMCPTASAITGTALCRPRNITLENVEVECMSAGYAASLVAKDAAVPEKAGDYPDPWMFDHMILPAWGLYARHVDGLTLKNVDFRLEPNERTDDSGSDLRRPYVFEDVVETRK